jgi:5-methylcytosine-specific restriction protein B
VQARKPAIAPQESDRASPTSPPKESGWLVPPSEQPIRDGVKDTQTQVKARELFQKVSGIFQKEYLNSDFKAEEVQLGHSYFLADNLEILRLKLEYEIKPILCEYLKDGILNQKAENEIKKLTI